jgi:phosphatidylglycerol:prolipoprotein diacylglycerol transferase
VFPVLVRVGGWELHSAGAMYVIAVIAVLLYAYRAARVHGRSAEHVLPGVTIVVIAAYIGARLHGAMSQPAAGFDVWRPGALSFFGGLALGSLALLGYLRLAGLPVGKATDVLAPMAPVVYALFRLGCLLNGDDYGPPTSMPWGMSFPAGSPPTGERVHPTPLYEIALMVPIYLWLRSHRRRRLPEGAVGLQLCLLLGLERFVVDFWREADSDVVMLPSQWFALVVVAIGAGGLLVLQRRSRQPTLS